MREKIYLLSIYKQCNVLGVAIIKIFPNLSRLNNPAPKTFPQDFHYFFCVLIYTNFDFFLRSKNYLRLYSIALHYPFKCYPQLRRYYILKRETK